MTTFYLLRHATNPWVGRALAGHLPGVHLNEEGLAQAEALVGRFHSVRLEAIYSSPLERARETAAPLARDRGMEVTVRPGLIEVGAGAWAGSDFATLDADPVWKRYNSFRSSTRGRGQGELMTEIATRMVDEMEELRTKHAGGNVLLVSHGDVIKVAVAHYAGVPVDLMQRIEISPASVSILQLADEGPRVLAVNDTGSLQR